MEEASSPSTAKRRLIALMQAGHPWQQAATLAGIQIGRSAAYQLLRKFRGPRRNRLARWATWASGQTPPTRAPVA
jgi:hypothetical protein